MESPLVLGHTFDQTTVVVYVLAALIIGLAIGSGIGFVVAMVLVASGETRMVDPPQGPSANGDTPSLRRTAR